MPLDNRTGQQLVLPLPDQDHTPEFWTKSNFPPDAEDRVQRDFTAEADEGSLLPASNPLDNDCAIRGYEQGTYVPDPQPLRYKRMGADMNYITMTEDISTSYD